MELDEFKLTSWILFGISEEISLNKAELELILTIESLRFLLNSATDFNCLDSLSSFTCNALYSSTKGFISAFFLWSIFDLIINKTPTIKFKIPLLKNSDDIENQKLNFYIDQEYLDLFYKYKHSFKHKELYLK